MLVSRLHQIRKYVFPFTGGHAWVYLHIIIGVGICRCLDIHIRTLTQMLIYALAPHTNRHTHTLASPPYTHALSLSPKQTLIPPPNTHILPPPLLPHTHFHPHLTHIQIHLPHPTPNTITHSPYPPPHLSTTQTSHMLTLSPYLSLFNQLPLPTHLCGFRHCPSRNLHVVLNMSSLCLHQGLSRQISAASSQVGI